MRENGARLTGKNADFGGFSVLRYLTIDPHKSLLWQENSREKDKQLRGLKIAELDPQ